MSHCQCSDKYCHVHDGTPSCEQPATTTLYRVDMDDQTGTEFCEDCAADAMHSGLFTEYGEMIEVVEGEPCPACNGEGVPLGSLGWTQHYRCQDCGWTFSR